TPGSACSSRNASGSDTASKVNCSRISTGAVLWLIPKTKSDMGDELCGMGPAGASYANLQTDDFPKLCRSLRRRGADRLRGAPTDAPLEFSSPSAALNYYLLLGEIAVSRDRLDEATDAFIAALPYADDPGIAERAAQLALHAGRLDDAARAAERWQALEPDAS